VTYDTYHESTASRFDRGGTIANELIDAIEAGDEPRARRVLQGHPELSGERDDNGLSPLTLAMYQGLPNLARAIREELDQLDIFEAAAVGELDRLRAIAPEPSDVNVWSPDGFTPLHLAAFFKHPEAVRLLVDNGADLEAISRNRTFAPEARPLHSAAAAGDVEVSRILLDAGADPNARQHGGFTPLMAAEQSGNRPLAELLRSFGATA
jgi:uncharacterized protein